jgi:protease-4
MVSPADKIYALMESELPINGFSAGATFLGDAMDKIGVHWDVARVGAYKNAPDALTRSQMSKEQAESINAYLDTDVQVFQSAVRTARKIDQPTIEATWKEGLLTPQRAKALGLIDEVITIADIPSRVAQWIPNASYDPSYRPKQTRDNYWGRRPQVAIVPIVGLIAPGRSQRDPFGLSQTAGSDTVVKAIRRAADNDSVDAIVVRVDSSGGDGLASNLIYQAVVEARKKKPVIASMGDVAASGGYYAAMGAEQVFASPTTITGSIGVFLIKPGLSPLANKLGIHHETIKRGDLSDFLNWWDPWTPTQRAAAQKWVDSFYDNFITEVAKSRKLPKERVDEIARGRVWSGKDAQTRGLVDKLGGIFEAIEGARRKAGIPDGADVDLVVYAEPRGWFAGLAGDESFLARMFGEQSDSTGGLPEGLRALAKELGLEQAFLLEPTVKAMMPFTLKVE